MLDVILMVIQCHAIAIINHVIVANSCVLCICEHPRQDYKQFLLHVYTEAISMLLANKLSFLNSSRSTLKGHGPLTSSAYRSLNEMHLENWPGSVFKIRGGIPISATRASVGGVWL